MLRAKYHFQTFPQSCEEVEKVFNRTNQNRLFLIESETLDLQFAQLFSVFRFSLNLDATLPLRYKKRYYKKSRLSPVTL